MRTPLDMKGVRAVVIGQGSIGQRHARLLAAAGASVARVSAQAEGAFRSVADVPDIAAFDYAVVANDTSRHGNALAALAKAGFSGRVLVEKPLLARLDEARATQPFAFGRLRVGYNLRMHPAVLAFRDRIAGAGLVSVRMHAGQYLPDWRPGTDYKTGSSASIARGGGVLRDLSHEIDMLRFLFGDWRRLVAVQTGKMLDIETDEAWSVMFEMASGATATLTLNYHDKPAERRYVATTERATVSADLIAAALVADGERLQLPVPARDDTYLAMHAMMMDDEARDILCTHEEGVAAVATIDAIERSARERRWIEHA